MGLPVIATNWSGPTAYLVSYAETLAGRQAVGRAMRGHRQLPVLGGLKLAGTSLHAEYPPCPQDESVGYPLPIEGLVDAGPDAGGQGGAACLAASLHAGPCLHSTGARVHHRP